MKSDSFSDQVLPKFVNESNLFYWFFFVLIVNLAYFATNTIARVKIKIFKSRNTKSLDKN